ncbi:hypothetical protein BGZ83_001087 [Gryganskiella cystojenkinii]|nr:hypothetical protein BGZ83_001087 [Gryganskiella cystojenkinii]
MTYNLKDPNTPIINGRLLAVVTNVLERVGEITGVTQHLCNDAGIYVLRGIDYQESPTTMPIWAPVPEMIQAAVADGKTTLTADEYLRRLQEAADSEVNSAGPSSSSPTPNNCFRSCRDFYISYRKDTGTDPIRVAEELIAFIKQSDEISPPLGAVWNWNEESIRKQAKASAMRYLEGNPLSIIDGVPIVVKDEVDVEGYETGVGTKFINKGNPAKSDAHLVALLRAKGAIIFGKSTMHEIGLGLTNFNPSTTTPRNPYQPNHSTGGSSGGSAAAVAAGLCPIAIGCDGGGSVREPSAYCGIYGLKPTQGRLSARGEYPLAPTVALSGPMCANMEDLAIVYAIISGQDEQDSNSMFQPPVTLPSPTLLRPSSTGLLQGLRIGIYRQWFEDVSHPEIAKICYTTLDSLVKIHGAVLVDIEIPELFENGKAHNITIVTEMLTKVWTHDKHHQSTYACEGGIVDVIVTPSTGNLPPKVNAGALSHGESNYLNSVKAMQYMMMCNFTGIPGITAVAGYTQEKYVHKANGDQYETGFPIGIQFMGQWWDEKRLIHIASVCETVLESRQKPKIWVGDYTQ